MWDKAGWQLLGLVRDQACVSPKWGSLPGPGEGQGGGRSGRGRCAGGEEWVGQDCCENQQSNTLCQTYCAALYTPGHTENAGLCVQTFAIWWRSLTMKPAPCLQISCSPQFPTLPFHTFTPYREGEAVHQRVLDHACVHVGVAQPLHGLTDVGDSAQHNLCYVGNSGTARRFMR